MIFVKLAEYLSNCIQDYNNNRQGYVYFIYRQNMPNVIKVGFTVDLNKRIKCGQTFNDSKLILYKADIIYFTK